MPFHFLDSFWKNRAPSGSPFGLLGFDPISSSKPRGLGVVAMPDILRTTVDFHSSTDDFSTFVNPDGLSSTTNNQVVGTSVAVVVPIHKVGLTRDELGDDLDWFELVG